jgi:hypothetical protein
LSKSIVAASLLIFFPIVFGIFAENEKARWRIRRRAWVFLESVWLFFTSGHSSPPAWRSHDDGGDRDGGGSASN